ncbi:MAG: ubiquinol-cytochrome c reductase iron-sulfur subunit [Rickettsiales bacterium]
MKKTNKNSPENQKRRDFIVLTASALTAVGGATALWPFIDSMNPSADVLALASVEVDLNPIDVGQTVKVLWRGKPVFVRHRTQKDVQEAQDVNWHSLPDPQPDSARVKPGKSQWLVMIGVCTHLGCIPIGDSGDYHGWFCPCHGSHYDTSGRIRKGPAPLNLIVPDYEFISDTKIKIG